jgi:hypothetical protein
MDNARLSRRRFIKSAGVTITLPMLPSLLYSRRAGAATCAPVKRFLAYHFANGHYMPEHMPTGVGSGSQWTLPPMLAPMQALKADLNFFSNLENQERRRSFGDHAIGCGAMLTARRPTPNEQTMSSSVDQIIADAQKGCRGMDSIQLGMHHIAGGDAHGTYYTRNISWRGPTVQNSDGTMSFPSGPATPLYKIYSVVQAFDKLFKGTDANASAAEAAKIRALRQSVLDVVVPHEASLKVQLNPEDRGKLEQLFTGIRELELKIQRTTTTTTGTCPKPDAPPASLDKMHPDPGDQPPAKLDIMHTMMAIAFQCDITRVISFMQGDAQNEHPVSYYIKEVSDLGGGRDHGIAHESGPNAKMKSRALTLWKMQRIAEFLTKLKTTMDFDGRPLLYNSLVLISSELSDASAHNHDNVPIVLAGQLGGLVKTDRHVSFPRLANRDFSKVKTFGDFYITLLKLYDVKTTTFGNDGKEDLAWNA